MHQRVVGGGGKKSIIPTRTTTTACVLRSAARPKISKHYHFDPLALDTERVLVNSYHVAVEQQRHRGVTDGPEIHGHNQR